MFQSDVEQILNGRKPPRFIAIEGPIGVGKTTLAKRLAASFNCEMILEGSTENPFLPKFYRSPEKAALSTQLFFLMQRTQQLQALRQQDLFEPMRVADFLLEKDPLFAKVTLDEAELALYRQVYQHIALDAPAPDLVIYLQASTDLLLGRIRARGVEHEQFIQTDYLEALADGYTELFHYYDHAPLLIVNATRLDWVNNERDYLHLVDYLLDIKSGRHYLNAAAGGLHTPGVATGVLDRVSKSVGA